ncbi:MBL fold metallo-hydrolase [Flavobacterium psychrotrophum]|uniref:MBL fold metallo-hydrolase n=1 Tax=Flavobacterium psychrotrophum TaxID=2294119 RepID=UPI000E31F5DB|nr:MBL fold metallo-hydrolase [Flavobacterium psychrotrophum]
MYFQHVYDTSLAQASYFIGCQAKGEAIVIDAKRDMDTYLEIAAQNNMKITHIAETHIHADFLAGSRELAAVTGATMYLSDEGGDEWQYEFDHVGLKHGDILKVGKLTLEVLHTPGHTPESISFLLTDHPATDKPVMVFTGDFVFVGDIGRPDLLEKAAGYVGTQEKGARQMYDSLQRFAELPGYVQVWPGHGAGSACGKSLGAVPSSTVGYEVIRNWAFQYENNEQGFVDYLLEGQPEPPKYFAMMKHLNKVNRPLLINVPKHKKLTKEKFDKAYTKGITIIDTRSKADFAKAHLPGSINIQDINSFATWCGWILNYDKPFILIADTLQMDGLTRKLMRIGLDSMLGFIEDITQIGITPESSEILNIEQFQYYIGLQGVQVIDVRNATEYNAGHIEGAENIFVGTLEKHLDRIDKSKEIVIHCQSGDRATIAQSLLAKNGFKEVKNYAGGMKEWNEKMFQVMNS